MAKVQGDLVGQMSCRPSCTGNVGPAAVSLAYSILTIDSATKVAGSTLYITVVAKDSYSNYRRQANDNGSGAFIVIVGSGNPITLTYTTNGIYTGSVTLVQAGNIPITMKLSTGPAISVRSVSVLNSVPSASHCQVQNTGSATIAAGSQMTLTVSLFDLYNNPVLEIIPEQISVIATSTDNTTITGIVVHSSANIYSVVLNGTHSGIYTVLTAVVENSQFTKVSQLTLTVTPSAASASRSLVICTSSNSVCGLFGTSVDVSAASFVVILYDQYGNGATATDYTHSLAVTYNGTSITNIVRGNDLYTYLVTFTPTQLPGPITITVALSGTPISGSPFFAFQRIGAISASATQLSYCGTQDGASCSIPTSISLSAGSQVNYMVISRDKFGNMISTGGAIIDVTLTGAIITPTRPAYSHALIASDNNDGTYSFAITPTLSGTYNLRVSYAGTPISGSNQAISIAALTVASGSASMPSGSAVTSAVAGVPNMFSIQLSDQYGNYLLDAAANSRINITMAATASLVTQGFQAVFNGVVSNSGNGVHSMQYLASWPGTYQMFVSIGLQGNVPSQSVAGSPFQLVVIPFTCAARNASTPFYCADNNGTCVSNPSQCVKKPCPAYTCSDGSCVTALANCTCPLGYIRCPYDGRCVSGNTTSACLVNQPCPTSTPYRCPDLSCQVNSQACANALTCTPGFVLCPNWLSCQTTLSLCISAPSSIVASPVCSGNTPLLCADLATCVGSFSDCPTATTCPSSKPVKCGDGSCRESTASCLPPRQCFTPTPVLCSDGSCATTISNCPTPRVCPLSAPILCASNQCVAEIGLCGSSISCPPDLVRCPTGVCAVSYPLCPSSSVCKAGQIKCADNSCSYSSSNCPSVSSCPAGLIYCPDGSCALQFSLCPTSVTCPSSVPVLCADNSCVTDAALCGTPPTCPTSLPLLCPGGSCATTLSNCPQFARCPTVSIFNTDFFYVVTFMYVLINALIIESSSEMYGRQLRRKCERMSQYSIKLCGTHCYSLPGWKLSVVLK